MSFLILHPGSSSAFRTFRVLISWQIAEIDKLVRRT
nr:MAG TPA: hypothetical protein [Caudoviricetes sp.]